jgi:periplasmic protein TonB
MNTGLSFTNQEFLLIAGAVVAGLALLVFAVRMYFNSKSGSGLTEKHRAQSNATQWETRNKYPEVDVFRWSGMFFRIAMVAVLVVILGAFNLTTYERQARIPQGALDLGQMDIEVEPPRSSEPPPPPPPPPPPVIQEVPNETILDVKDVEFLDQSVEAHTAIEAPAVVERRPEVKYAPPPPPPPSEPEHEEIFKVVEEMPRFPGCENLPTNDERKACADKKMLQFIYDNIQYPAIARENGIEGTVVVRFVVDADGTISSAEVVRDIGGRCGDEALRVVKLMNSMPQKWTPGRQRGKPVRVWFNLPVKFILEYN